MIYIEVSDQIKIEVNPALPLLAAQATLKHQKARQDSDLTIVITDDMQLQELSRKYLNIDAPTDVLSFPAEYTDPETDHPYLGDVLISYPQAEAQASAANHTVETEILLLTVHGVLHLLGHDHQSSAEKTRMWTAQDQILRGLGHQLEIP